MQSWSRFACNCFGKMNHAIQTYFTVNVNEALKINSEPKTKEKRWVLYMNNVNFKMGSKFWWKQEQVLIVSRWKTEMSLLDVQQHWCVLSAVFVLSSTVVSSSVCQVSVVDGQVWSGLNWIQEFFSVSVPGVVHCWVCITAAAQSHWTTLQN